jgi:hypothetical protein
MVATGYLYKDVKHYSLRYRGSKVYYRDRRDSEQNNNDKHMFLESRR